MHRRKEMKEVIKKGYVRVSDIIKPYVDFSHIPPHILEAKAAIGTEVHEYIEAHYEGELRPVSEKARAYIPAFKSALATDLKDCKPKVTEERLYSDSMKITGRIDMLTTDDVLIDYKTSAVANTTVWSIQLALYVILLKENGLVDKPQAKVLHLKKGGSFSLIDLKLKNEHYNIATTLVKNYWYFQA